MKTGTRFQKGYPFSIPYLLKKSVFFNQNYAGSGKCLSPALFLKSMILELTKINVVLITNFERKIASLCEK